MNDRCNLTATSEGMCDFSISEFDGSAKLVADCTIAAALDNIDLLITLVFLAQTDLIVEPMCLNEGNMTVPSGPGLGVSLDTDALDKFRPG